MHNVFYSVSSLMRYKKIKSTRKSYHEGCSGVVSPSISSGADSHWGKTLPQRRHYGGLSPVCVFL